MGAEAAGKAENRAAGARMPTATSRFTASKPASLSTAIRRRVWASIRQAIDTTLYSAFGQRQVSTMYTGINQYHVVLEVLPEFQQNPAALQLHLCAYQQRHAGSVSTFTHLRTVLAPLTVNHQGQFPSITLSFNLAPGVALSEAVNAVNVPKHEIGMPANVHGTFRAPPKCFGFARVRAAADSSRSGGGLHRARNAVRELHSSDHDSLDSAFGGSWRVARVAHHQHGFDRHRPDRDHSC